MSKDLEEQLNELGPAYRSVVARLRAAREVEPGEARQRQRPFLIAASLLAVIGLGVVLWSSERAGEQPANSCYTVRVTDADREYALAVLRDDQAVQDLIRTQKPDGSWKTDDLTRRNAELLKTCRSEAAQKAYRKAMDSLRARGLL